MTKQCIKPKISFGKLGEYELLFWKTTLLDNIYVYEMVCSGYC